MLLTILAITSVIFWPLAIGAVCCAAIRRRVTVTKADWIDASFVGGAVLVIALQNAVYLGWPVKYTAFPVLLVALAVGLFTIRGRWHEVRDAVRAFPMVPLGVAVGAYLVHGLGLLTVGASHYMGRAWLDQLNYTSLADYLLRYPYDLPISADLPPHILLATVYRESRIGQSVLQAFFAAVTGGGPKELFEPLILWSVFLTALAAYAIARAARLPRLVAVVVEMAAAGLPALAYVHLESFLSHALATPYLLYSLLMAFRVLQAGRTADYIICALVLTATAALYLELLPFLVALVAALVVWQMGRRPIRWPHVLWSASLVFVPLLLNNPASIRHVLGYVGGKDVLSVIYPWALTVEGLQRLWLGDLVSHPSWLNSPVTRIFAAAMTVLGYLGLLQFSTDYVRRSRVQRGRAPMVYLSLAVLGISCVPWLIILVAARYPYQFYKLLLTISPLLACGVGIFTWSVCRAYVLTRRPVVPAIIVLALACPSLLATAEMALASGRPEHNAQGRQNTGVVLGRGFKTVADVLEDLQGQQVVTCTADPLANGGFVNGWVNYFARSNRVWSLNPRASDQNLNHLNPNSYLSGFPKDLPPGSVILTSQDGALWAQGSHARRHWRAGPIAAYDASAGPFAVLCHASLHVSSGWRPQVILAPDVPDMLIVSHDDGDARLVGRAADPATRDALATQGLSVNGMKMTPMVRDDGRYVLGLDLKRGLNRVTASFTPATPSGLRLGDMEFLLGREWVEVGLIDNPNGLEQAGGRNFFWLGGKPTTIALMTGAAGFVHMRFELGAGPSVGRTGVRRLHLETDEGYEATVDASLGLMSVWIPVAQGQRRIVVTALDEPEPERRLAHDPRPLVAGVWDLAVSFEAKVPPSAATDAKSRAFELRLERTAAPSERKEARPRGTRSAAGGAGPEVFGR